MNGIKIYGRYYAAPATWEQLSPAQALYTLWILSQPQSYENAIRLLLCYLSPKSSLHAWLFKKIVFFFLSEEDLYHAIALTNFAFLQKPSLSFTQLPPIQHHTPQDLSKITFEEFITIETALHSQNTTPILSAIYPKANISDSQKYAAIAQAAAVAYNTFQEKLKKRFPRVFSKPELENSKKTKTPNPAAAWAETLYTLAGGVMQMEEYAKLPVIRVLYDIEMRIKQAEKQEQALRQRKK